MAGMASSGSTVYIIKNDGGSFSVGFDIDPPDVDSSATISGRPLPAWEIVEPPPADELLAHYQQWFQMSPPAERDGWTRLCGTRRYK